MQYLEIQAGSGSHVYSCREMPRQQYGIAVHAIVSRPCSSDGSLAGHACGYHRENSPHLRFCPKNITTQMGDGRHCEETSDCTEPLESVFAAGRVTLVPLNPTQRPGLAELKSALAAPHQIAYCTRIYGVRRSYCRPCLRLYNSGNSHDIWRKNSLFNIHL